MEKRLHAVFDGKVLIPEEQVELEIGEHCELIIEGRQSKIDVEDVEKDFQILLTEL